MDAQRIAIIGGGAVGSVLAAAAHASGHRVVLCVRTLFERLTLETPEGTQDVPVTICSHPDEVPDVDWVVLSTKVQDVPGSAPWLRGLDNSRRPLVVVQNGIEHEKSVAEFGLRAPLLPTLIYVGAERLRPGYVVRRSAAKVTVPAGELGSRFVGLFDHAGTIPHQTDDFHTDAWRKMLWNLAANPITALTLRRLAVFADPEIREFAEGVLTEAIAVACAEGADLSNADTGTILAAYSGEIPPENGTSMLYDRLAGLPTEHEHINGLVVRAGRRHGIPTPLNQALLALMRAVQPA